MLFCHLAWRFVYASSSFPSIFLSFPLRLDRERVALSPPLATFVFFLFLFYDGRRSKKKEEKRCRAKHVDFFFIFFDSSFDEWRIRLFGIGWGVVL